MESYHFFKLLVPSIVKGSVVVIFSTILHFKIVSSTSSMYQAFLSTQERGGRGGVLTFHWRFVFPNDGSSSL